MYVVVYDDIYLLINVLQFVLEYFHLLIVVLHVQDVHFLLVNEQ